MYINIKTIIVIYSYKMLDPLVKYRTYHRDKINIRIHEVCVPLLLMSIYSVCPVYFSFSINVFYSIIYLLLDVCSKNINKIKIVKYISKKNIHK